LSIADLIRNTDPNGTHVDQLASKCSVESARLAQILRSLSAQGIFKEVAPDTFANNRLSSVFDKGLSEEDVRGSSQSHDALYKTPQSGTCALYCHLTDEGAKTSSHLLESLTKQRTNSSPTAVKTAFSMAFNTDASYWDFMEVPTQENRLRRFGFAMEGVAKTEPQDAILRGFDWESVPDGGQVVDVGGGVGSISMRLANAYPKLNIVVQDRPPVIEEGVKRWATINPAAIAQGRVKLQGHDFFQSQPIKNPDVFFMKSIIHDWPDDDARTILRNLREASSPNTRLFSMDKIIPYTCETGALEVEGVEIIGPASEDAKAGSGFGNVLSYLSSVCMMTFINGQERTLKHTIKLFHEAGWEIYKIYQSEVQGEFASQIHAKPVNIV